MDRPDRVNRVMQLPGVRAIVIVGASVLIAVPGLMVLGGKPPTSSG